MPDILLLALALLSAAIGMGWLAIAMDVHWRQVHNGRARSRASRIVLRGLGAGALLGSLILCLIADVATMATLVWMMFLAISAALVAFLLSWRPRTLRALAPAFLA